MNRLHAATVLLTFFQHSVNHADGNGKFVHGCSTGDHMRSILRYLLKSGRSEMIPAAATTTATAPNNFVQLEFMRVLLLK
jgi:hypothetical protein